MKQIAVDPEALVSVLEEVWILLGESQNESELAREKVRNLVEHDPVTVNESLAFSRQQKEKVRKAIHLVLLTRKAVLEKPVWETE